VTTTAWHLQDELRSSREQSLARLEESVSAHPRVRPLPSPHPAVAERVPGDPRRLMIFGLGVDVPVVPVRAPGGRLLPPADARSLGWWAGGARPGDRRGGTLIAGRAPAAGDGAFDDLGRLRPGDAVLVRTDRGVVRYAVARVRSYPRGAPAGRTPGALVRAADGDLVLVTCGDWNGRRYRSELVVTATPRP
jgi:hypothetical protein